jgi:hypothetical protein
VTVPATQLAKLLGTRELTVTRGEQIALVDTPLEH